MTSHRIAVVVALCASLACSATAHAQPDDKALAEALFRQGREKLEAGSTEQACELFDQSQRLERSVGTLLNLALCNEKLGRTATAWAAFVEVSVEARRIGQADRATFAKERADALEPQLSKLTLVFSERPDGLILFVDGAVVPSPRAGTALPFDPGERRVEVNAPGKKPWAQTVTLKPGPSAAELTVPALEDDLAEPTPPPVVAPPPAVAPAPPTTPSPPLAEEPMSSETNVSPLVPIGFSLGGAGLVVGIVTGVLSLHKADDVLQACPNDSCPESLRDDYDSAEDLANVSNVAFAIAGVGIGLGIIGLVVSDFGDGDVSASLTPTDARIRVRF